MFLPPSNHQEFSPFICKLIQSQFPDTRVNQTVMEDLRHPPNKVPESLYIVHDPSNDQVAGGKSSKSQESLTPWEIGFRPYDILSLSRKTASSFLPLHYGAANGPRRNPPSVYVTATDDIEAAENEVTASEDGLVMYTLDGRCEEMRKCAIFKASDWLRALEMWDGDENEDEDERSARQKRVGSEWLIWPSVPKEAVTHMSTREDILEDEGKFSPLSSSLGSSQILTS